NVEVDIRVRGRTGGFTGERFLESVQSRRVVAIGIQREPERPVAFGIGGIHAEGSTRFGEGILGIVRSIKQVRKLAVRFGEVRHQLGGNCKLVERLVEPVLAPQNGSKYEMQ